MQDLLQLSFAELHRRTGVHSVMWSRYAHRQADPNFGTINKIATGLGISNSEVLYLIDLQRKFISRRVIA